MSGILCPYCVNVEGKVIGDTVTFRAHTIDHANNGPYKEWCPIGGKSFIMTEYFRPCKSCNQYARILRKDDSEVVLAGHHFSWGLSETEEKIKVPPHGGYFSRVMCNTHVEGDTVYISENLPIFTGGMLTSEANPALLN